MRQRINLTLALISLVAIIAAAVGITLVYFGLFENRVKANLEVNAKLLMAAGFFQDPREADNKSWKLDPEALGAVETAQLRITWIDSDGKVLYDNDLDSSALPNHLDRPEVREALKSGSGESTRRSDSMKLNTLYYAVLLENGTVLRVSAEVKSIAGLFLTALPVISLIAAAVLVFCILIGHALTGKLVRPIEQMAEDLGDGGRTPAYRELKPFVDKIRVQHENILAAARSRQDFTANVSHELKTPITAISGYSELIENNMVDAGNLGYIAQQIRRNADRLQLLITDIIQLSELDDLEQGSRFEKTDLYFIAQECCRDLAASARKKGVSLICRGNAAGISADPALIREMIENLVQNAIRYNKENGSVFVNVSIEDGHPILRVKDTGIGIPADQRERVFERFYRVDRSRSRQTGGTGLGLAIVKHIAQLHSAEIRLDSEMGRGTEIEIRF